jgi:hypothetical protein
MVGPAGPIAPTQKKLDLKFCEFFRIKDGLVSEGHTYFDAATLMRQLGVSPQTPAPVQPVSSGR